MNLGIKLDYGHRNILNQKIDQSKVSSMIRLVCKINGLQHGQKVPPEDSSPYKMIFFLDIDLKVLIYDLEYAESINTAVTYVSGSFMRDNSKFICFDLSSGLMYSIKSWISSFSKEKVITCSFDSK